MVRQSRFVPTRSRAPSPKASVELEPCPARFLNHGNFAAYAAALKQLGDWAELATGAGYPLPELAAWITVGRTVRVQLATRDYWQPLTPRGHARDALLVRGTQDLLCLVFQRGQVETFHLTDLRRLHDAAANEAGTSSSGMSGAA